MSDVPDITFWHYDDPLHDTQVIPATPGVTPGYIVLSDRGQSWSIPFAVLTAPDGSQAFEQTGEAVEVTIVDDTLNSHPEVDIDPWT